MATQLEKVSQRLYDLDYNLWALETVEQLKNREFNALDLENLIEEVLDLSQRDQHKLESLLIQLLEHLLKLGYWESERRYHLGHWQGEVTNFCKQIKRVLKASPSLHPYLEDIFPVCYQDAREILSRRCQLPIETFPERPLAGLDQVLDENWFLE